MEFFHLIINKVCLVLFELRTSFISYNLYDLYKFIWTYTYRQTSNIERTCRCCSNYIFNLNLASMDWTETTSRRDEKQWILGDFVLLILEGWIDGECIYIYIYIYICWWCVYIYRNIYWEREMRQWEISGMPFVDFVRWLICCFPSGLIPTTCMLLQCSVTE